jgi:hypothetical protein
MERRSRCSWRRRRRRRSRTSLQLAEILRVAENRQLLSRIRVQVIEKDAVALGPILHRFERLDHARRLLLI